MEPPAARPRCAEHDLAVDDEGRCVLCRRAPARRTPWASLAILMLTSAAAFAGYRRLSTPPPETMGVTVEPAPEAPRTQGERAPEPPERDMPLAVTPPTGAAPAGAAHTARPQRVEREEEQRAQLVAEMQRTHITLYSTKWCPSCRKARAWLEGKGYRFVEHDIEANPAVQRLFVQLNPKRTVPTLVVDGEILVGFSGSRIERILEESAERRLARAR